MWLIWRYVDLPIPHFQADRAYYQWGSARLFHAWNDQPSKPAHPMLCAYANRKTDSDKQMVPEDRLFYSSLHRPAPRSRTEAGEANEPKTVAPAH